MQIYKERFANAGDFTFLFVGSFDEDSIKPLIEKYIGSLPGLPKKETFKDLGIRPPTGMVKKEINRGSDPKSLVAMVFNTPAVYTAKEAFTINSLAELMSIKLIEQLREEKGGVYGINAFGSFNRIPVPTASFTITFPCAPENADTLSKAVLEEFKKIIEHGVSEEDLEKIKEQQKRSLEVASKQNRFWMDNIYDAFFYGTNPAEILNKQKLTDELTSKMIQDAAKKYINLNSFIIATLKPDKQEEKPLKGF